MDPPHLGGGRGGQGHRAHLVLHALQRGQRLRLRAHRRARPGPGPELGLDPVVHRDAARDGPPLPARAGPGASPAGRRADHQRPVAGHRAHERRVPGEADLPDRGRPLATGRLLVDHGPHAGHRRADPGHRGPRAVRGGLPHPAHAPDPRGARGRHPDRAPAGQRAHPGPDHGRHLGPGERQRADGEPGAAADGGVRARLARGARRRALRPLGACDARGHPRGARRHLPLRHRHRRLRGAVPLPRRPHRGRATASWPTSPAPRRPSRAPSTA